MRHALLIKPNGETLHIEPQFGNKFEPEEVKANIGGWIELVGKTHIGKIRIPAYGDEEARLKNATFNHYASRLVGYQLYGDIMFIPKDMFVW